MATSKLKAALRKQIPKDRCVREVWCDVSGNPVSVIASDEHFTRWELYKIDGDKLTRVQQTKRRSDLQIKP